MVDVSVGVRVSVSVAVSIDFVLLLFLSSGHALIYVLSLLRRHLLRLVFLVGILLRSILNTVLSQRSRLIRETCMLLLNALEHFVQTLLLHATSASSTASTATSCGAWGSAPSATTATSSTSNRCLVLRILSHVVLSVVC